MAVTGMLLTVAEFAQLPQPAGAVRQELHHGKLVEFPPVKMLHTKTQRRSEIHDAASVIQSAVLNGSLAVSEIFV